ncbi:MAG: 3-hydroxybutyrate dehydrogenase [Isosphaeraceae bacterium]
MRLIDQVAIVTGAAGGIGRRIAERFALEGAAVAIADIQHEAAEAAADAIEREGGRALPLPMDVSREDQVEAGVRAVVRNWGRVDILVSNAGQQHIAPIVDLEFSDWKRVLAVHLDGAFLTTRACMRAMIEGGRGGTILYMGSVHSVEASPLKAPYVAAKHALLGLARSVAKEGAPYGIRSNVICPGFVRTPLVDRQIPEQAQALGICEEEVIQKVMLKQTVDGQFTTLDDVAEAAVFLASFPTSALTGQSLIISHGWHMG